MPTAESSFPKVGNDPLYASEVNRFGIAGGFLGAGSNNIFTAVGSSSNGLPCGSIVIGAGSVTNPCVLDIFWHTSSLGATTQFDYIQISGTTGDSGKTFGTSEGGGHTVMGRAFGIMAQTDGYVQIIRYQNDGNLRSSGLQFNINPASGLVVLFGIKHANNAGSVNISRANVQFMREGY